MPINRDAISSLISVKEGAPFRQELNDDSMRVLSATKLFDLVEVRTDGPAGMEELPFRTCSTRRRMWGGFYS
jgi:outer membrane protein assembly factor BamA